MGPSETSKLINFVGGDTAFAQLLGLDRIPGHQQRVNNWKRRGIPADVVLDHYDIIQELKAKLENSEPRMN
jgi:hypothetical protein